MLHIEQKTRLNRERRADATDNVPSVQVTFPVITLIGSFQSLRTTYLVKKYLMTNQYCLTKKSEVHCSGHNLMVIAFTNV